ncbi:MAG: hypothetical protein WC208_08215 [Gallionella sp.]|jgi:hypothetical protein
MLADKDKIIMRDDIADLQALNPDLMEIHKTDVGTSPNMITTWKVVSPAGEEAILLTKVS